MNFRMADFNFIIKNDNYYIEKSLAPYSSIFPSPDLEIEISREDKIYELRLSENPHTSAYLEFISAYRKIAEWLPSQNAFVLHSATFDVDGVGVAFAAHSGTGKSTHMQLWQNLLGERMTVVNGDKPIVRFFDDEPNTPYAYGTPWNGKERLGCNMRTPLRHICFIERAKENSVEKMLPTEAINRIFNQVYMPKDPMAVTNTMALINRLISSCSLWKIKCNMDPDAAETSYNAIFGSK